MTAALLVSLLTGPPAAATPVESHARTCTLHSEVATWSLRRMAWQTVVVPALESHVGAVSPEVAAGAGGVILFGSKAPSDLDRRLQRLSAGARGGIAPIVMSDEEGGAVQRMANLVGTMPSARRMGKTLTPTEIRSLARRVGTRMAANGVGMNLAPVLDLDDGPGPSATNPIGTRSFSIDPTKATRDGLAFARGMLDAGVVPVVKHFPGLGQATANTDDAAAWTKPWSNLQTHGLKPFTSAIAAGMPAVMVTNARVPGLTRMPGTLSFAVTHQVLRRQLGFDGLVVTDALSSGAIRAAGYGVPRASVRALRVGADMVLFNAQPADVAAVAQATVDRIVGAVRAGVLPRTRLEHAVVHVLEAKQVQPCP